jgi:hypothetical protein
MVMEERDRSNTALQKYSTSPAEGKRDRQFKVVFIGPAAGAILLKPMQRILLV